MLGVVMNRHLKDGVSGTVGDTPLIRLNSLSKATGCEILGKAEFLNPGGSVKDRAAMGIIEDAETRNLLGPGGTIVEGTAGNTGIALALIGNAKGYRTIIVIPDTQSEEKINLLRATGAEVRLVPAVPYKDPNNYNHVARRLADDLDNGFWANQFDNTANRDYHHRTTGPEIYRQTGGAITAFVASVGTGGTLAGVAGYLKEKNPKIHTVCADPYGAAMWSWFTRGHLEIDDGDSVAEGIGQGRVTANIDGAPVDLAYRIRDRVMIKMLDYLVKEEGLLLGASSAINVCAAVKLARENGPGQVIATILCDNGQRYLSRLYNAEWLRSEGLDPAHQGTAFFKEI